MLAPWLSLAGLAPLQLGPNAIAIGQASPYTTFDFSRQMTQYFEMSNCDIS